MDHLARLPCLRGWVILELFATAKKTLWYLTLEMKKEYTDYIAISCDYPKVEINI